MIPIENMYQTVHDSMAFRKRFRMKHRNRPLSREVIRQITDRIKRYVEDDAFPMPQPGTLQNFCNSLVGVTTTARAELGGLLMPTEAGGERYIALLSQCYTGEPCIEHDARASTKAFKYDRGRLLTTLERMTKAARVLSSTDIGAVRVRPCPTVRADNLVASILGIAARSIHIGRGVAPAPVLMGFMEGLFKILDIQVDDLPEMVRRYFDPAQGEPLSSFTD